MEAFKKQIHLAYILKGGLIASQALPKTLGLLPTCINLHQILRLYHGPHFLGLRLHHGPHILGLRLHHGPHILGSSNIDCIQGAATSLPVFGKNITISLINTDPRGLQMGVKQPP